MQNCGLPSHSVDDKSSNSPLSRPEQSYATEVDTSSLAKDVSESDRLFKLSAPPGWEEDQDSRPTGSSTMISGGRVILSGCEGICFRAMERVVQ